MSFENRLGQLVARHKELMALMGEPGLSADKYTAYAKEARDLDPIVEKVEIFTKAKTDMENLSELMKDPEMRDLAETEYYELKEKLPQFERDVQVALLPRDKADAGAAILEIRAGTGGQEAALFAADLFAMYKNFAAVRGWRMEVIEAAESDLGGFKEVVVEVTGQEVYGTLKFESGVHRVQRVPETESQGRVHTSAATVAVLPEAEEVVAKIDPKDLKIDTYRSSGAGGQHVNTTDSAVRITHLPSGLVVASQDGRSQHKNKESAMKVLASRLYDLERQKIDSERSADRKSQVGSGDRSERIRTYNYPQGRVTDHRINMTMYDLTGMMNGSKTSEIIDALLSADQAERLATIA